MTLVPRRGYVRWSSISPNGCLSPSIELPDQGMSDSLWFLCSLRLVAPRSKVHVGRLCFLSRPPLFLNPIEEIGVRTGFIFGAYHYSDQLGPKIGHVPLLIPLTWPSSFVPLGSRRALVSGVDTRSVGATRRSVRSRRAGDDGLGCCHGPRHVFRGTRFGTKGEPTLGCPPVVTWAGFTSFRLFNRRFVVAGPST